MADEIREDTMVWPTMTAMLGCVQTELEQAGRSVGNATVAYGSLVPALDLGDECDGFLWVRLTDAFPSSQFPNPDISNTSGAAAPMAFALEVAVARCVTIAGLDEDNNVRAGEPIPAVDIFEDARKQMADVAAIRRGICRCLNRDDKTYLLSNLTVQGPDGGVNYAGWTVYVQWDPGAD